MATVILFIVLSVWIGVTCVLFALTHEDMCSESIPSFIGMLSAWPLILSLVVLYALAHIVGMPQDNNDWPES